MAYVSLYRRYRPRTFADVVGQTHVTRTLANALDEDRLSHAYLFTGPRGTGKTSTARILAAAINCEHGPTSTPCGTCEHCVAITDGNSVDVIELDMASHGGVDDARELRDRALFAPARARRKIYILDEVHMASTAAFNALLKLIEEPPGHVLFAMATTDPQKVIPTILSRVQRLDLRRVPAAEVATHVRTICDSEGYRIDDGAVEAVVRAGDGSVRDTLSVLEQVFAYAGRDVTSEAVASTLGTTPTERVFALVELLAERELAGTLALVQGLLDEGHDLRRFTLDLVQHLRDLLVLQVAPEDPDLVDATEDRRRRLLAQSERLPAERLLRMVDLLADTVAEQRQGSPRLPLELALAKLAVPGAEGDLAGLADRVAALEAGAPRVPQADRPSSSRAGPPAGSVEEPVGDEPNASEGKPASSAAARARARAAAEPSPSPAPEVAEPAEHDPTAGEGARTEPSEDASAPVAEAEEATSEGVQAAAAPQGAPEGEAAGPAAAPEPTPEADDAEPADAAEPAPEADGPEPADAPEPVTLGADEEDPAVPDADDELALVTAHWEAVLESLKRTSRRHHAIFEPAEPVDVRRGILTLHYGRRYASFHAKQARTGELSGALTSALERACGLRLKLDVQVEGDTSPRRPVPPSVTPDDARTPVFEDRSEPAQPVTEDDDAEEELAVREAELDRPGEAEDVDQLLQRELGAELLTERPPPGEEEQPRG